MDVESQQQARHCLATNHPLTPLFGPLTLPMTDGTYRYRLIVSLTNTHILINLWGFNSFKSSYYFPPTHGCQLPCPEHLNIAGCSLNYCKIAYNVLAIHKTTSFWITSS